MCGVCQALLKNATEAMKESRVFEILSSVCAGWLCFPLKLQLPEVLIFVPFRSLYALSNWMEYSVYNLVVYVDCIVD